MQIRLLPLRCAALLLLVACTAPPGLDAGQRIAPSNQPVELLPLDQLLEQAKGGAATDASAAALAARAADLRARTAGQ